MQLRRVCQYALWAALLFSLDIRTASAEHRKGARAFAPSEPEVRRHMGKQTRKLASLLFPEKRRQSLIIEDAPEELTGKISRLFLVHYNLELARYSGKNSPLVQANIVLKRAPSARFRPDEGEINYIFRDRARERLAAIRSVRPEKMTGVKQSALLRVAEIDPETSVREAALNRIAASPFRGLTPKEMRSLEQIASGIYADPDSSLRFIASQVHERLNQLPTFLQFMEKKNKKPRQSFSPPQIAAK